MDMYGYIYAEIEEVGWEHLLSLEDDLSSVSFRVLDEKGRVHILEISLPQTYPQCSPSIAADVPYICEFEWSKNSKLKDIVQHFDEHLKKLQEFWSTMDEIDRALPVVDPRQPSHATSHRQINLGNGCHLLLSINTRNPKSLPECRFLGPDSTIEPIWRNWKKNGRKWKKDKNFVDNLATLLEFTLPKPPTVNSKEVDRTDCGICYAHYLPIDDELGNSSGSSPDYTCENTNCSKTFHSICLRDWLRSITTTRQSFDVLFGNCPYCSDPVAVKTNIMEQ